MDRSAQTLVLSLSFCASDATKGIVVRPFHTGDALTTENSYVLPHDPNATRLFVLCIAKDTKGDPSTMAQSGDQRNVVPFLVSLMIGKAILEKSSTKRR